MHVKDDRQLVNKILAGDKKAAEYFFKKYSQKLLNFILLKISDPADGEEILQDTLISAMDSLPLFSARSSLYTWLGAIAKHEVADFYRKKKIKTILFSRLPILEGLAGQALGPEEKLMKKEIKKQIRLVFKKLSEGYGQILRLKYIEGCSVAQIAKELNMTFKAVESKLFRARIAFQKQYAKENHQIFNSSFYQGRLPFSS
ncbi:RNA polymerase sigma factor [Candidatus Microgenomates bacterium]|nr:RNA polymerase sigma factor [Candidatus Microgenomates bacterium]